MTTSKKIIVRGKPRQDIDPALLVQVLLAIATDWDNPDEPNESPDVHDAAIEDRKIEKREIGG